MKAMIWRAARFKLLALALFAAFTIPVMLGPFASDDVQPDAVDVMDGRATAPGSAQALIEEHDCWTHKAPAGVIPGHVVVTKPGDIAPTYGGPELAGKALEQLFEGIDHDLIVHAFCR